MDSAWDFREGLIPDFVKLVCLRRNELERPRWLTASRNSAYSSRYFAVASWPRSRAKAAAQTLGYWTVLGNSNAIGLAARYYDEQAVSEDLLRIQIALELFYRRHRRHLPPTIGAYKNVIPFR